MEPDLDPGEELDLPTAVGMLAVGQHTMLCDLDSD